MQHLDAKWFFQGDIMNNLVERITEEVKLLDSEQREELLSWLSNYELSTMDEWDQEIACDSQPEGRLSRVLDRVRRDIATGRTKPLDQFLNNA